MNTPEPTPVIPQNRAFVAFARFVLRFRWVLLVLTLAATAFFTKRALRLETDTSIEAFLVTDSKAFLDLEELRDDFGRDELFIVIAEGKVFSLPFLERLRKLHGELEAIDLPLSTLGQRKTKRVPKASEEPTRPAAAALAPPAKPAAAPKAPGDALSEFDDEAPAVGKTGAARTAKQDALSEFDDEPAASPSAAAPPPSTGKTAHDSGWGQAKGGRVIDEVISLLNIRQTTSEAGSLRVRGLLDRWPTEAELPGLEKFALAEPSVVGRVVGKEGRHAAILLRTGLMSEHDSNKVHDEIMRIVGQHQAPGFTLHVSGLPAFAASLHRLMLDGLAAMIFASFILLVGWLAYIFRHPVGVVGPVLVVIQGVIWCFGTMAMFGAKLTMLGIMLPVFIVVVSVGDGIHLQHVYRDARKRGRANNDAIIEAMGSTGAPVVYTTLTTCAGMGSFGLTDVGAIRDVGIYGAWAVFAELGLSIVFLPILLSFSKTSLLGARDEQERTKGDVLDRFLSWCNVLSLPDRRPDGTLSFRRRNRAVLVGSVTTLVALAGVFLLRAYHNPIEWVPRGVPIREAFEVTDAHLGGTADVTLLVKAKPGKTLRDRELLLALEKVDQRVQAYQHPTEGKVVGGSVSLLDIVRESNRAMHDGSREHYRIPDTQGEVDDLLTLFENSAPDQLRRLATIDLERTIMVFRVKWLDASSYGPLTTYVQHAVDDLVGDRAEVVPTGSALNLLTLVDRLVRTSTGSFVFTIVVVGLMMIALVFDVRLGLLSMIPNVIPIGMVMGFMGYAGIPIDLNNVMLSSVATGIAVDNTIHFVYQFKRHLRQHGDRERAIEHAFEHTGRAIMTSALVLVAGFAVYLVADMRNVARFGMLLALTFAVSTFAGLVSTPYLLRVAYPVPRRYIKPKGVDDANPLSA